MNPRATQGAMLWIGLAASAVAQAEAPSDTARARQLVRSFERPAEARAAVRSLMEFGPAAIPPLHIALRDPRPAMVQWALFANTGLAGDLESLREPIRVLTASKDLGVAMAAAHAFAALDGKGTTLIADYHQSRVFEIDATEQRTVHEHAMTMSATRLPNGHLLVVNYEGNQVVEYDAKQVEIWSFRDLVKPSDAERLPNCNTLIASYEKNGVVEVDRLGAVVWQMPGRNVRDADRQLDSTTLVARTDEHRVVLVDTNRTSVQEWQLDFDANDADLLPNGHLLIAGNQRVVELDAAGKEVWRCDVGYAGSVVRYGRRVPSVPGVGRR